MCVACDKRRAMQNVSHAVRLAGGSMSSSRDAEVKGGAQSTNLTVVGYAFG
jgi:hypothetical protein